MYQLDRSLREGHFLCAETVQFDSVTEHISSVRDDRYSLSSARTRIESGCRHILWKTHLGIRWVSTAFRGKYPGFKRDSSLANKTSCAIWHRAPSSGAAAPGAPLSVLGKDNVITICYAGLRKTICEQ